MVVKISAFRIRAKDTISNLFREVLIIENIRSEDGALQNRTHFLLIEEAEKPVAWAYEVWDEFLAGVWLKSP
jgi:hypothetical protein